MAHSQLRQRKRKEEEGEEGDKDEVRSTAKATVHTLHYPSGYNSQSHVLHASGIVHDGSLLYFVMENALAILPKYIAVSFLHKSAPV